MYVRVHVCVCVCMRCMCVSVSNNEPPIVRSMAYLYLRDGVIVFGDLNRKISDCIAESEDEQPATTEIG